MENNDNIEFSIEDLSEFLQDTLSDVGNNSDDILDLNTDPEETKENLETLLKQQEQQKKIDELSVLVAENSKTADRVEKQQEKLDNRTNYLIIGIILVLVAQMVAVIYEMSKSDIPQIIVVPQNQANITSEYLTE